MRHAASGILQFQIPVEIISPGVGHTPDPNGDHEERDPVRLDGFLQKPEIRLSKGLAALFPIASVTTGHDVCPLRLPPVSPGNYVVKGEVLGRVANGDVGKELVIGPDDDIIGDGYAVVQDATGTDLNLGANDTERTNDCVVGNLGGGVDTSKGMDFGHFLRFPQNWVC